MSWISALLGLDASHNAGQAQQQSQNQLALQNQYGQQAAGVYGGLQQQGQGQANAYNGQFLGLLNQYGSLAGVGQPLTQTGPGNTPQNFANQNALLAGGQVPGNTQGQSTSPYQLDQNQQALLNQTTANLARQHQQAVSTFTEQMQAHGISDPRALQVGQETINEHFAALKSETETKFYEQIKEDKLKAMQQIISGLEGYGKTGIAEEESAGSGFLGLSAGAQSSSAQQQSQALQQQNLANSQMSGLAKLLGFGFGGGFGHAARSGVAFASDTSGPVA